MNALEKFHCHLALELGVPLATVLNMPVSELKRWKEYFREVWFTSDRQDFQLAQLTTLIFNTHYVDKKKMQDFMPWVKKVIVKDLNVNDKLEILRGILGG